MLGWGVRLLRAAAEPRRLRHRRDGRPSALGRPQQGGDDGHLLRRHQPAVHRSDTAAEPGRDCAPLGDRPGADDALSGRHAQHGVRLRVGAGADARGAAGRPRRSQQRCAVLGRPARRRGRHDLPGQSGAAPRGRRPRAEDPRQRPLRPRGRRPPLAAHVRRQDRRAGLHGLPVDRRADRRPLPDAGEAHDRDRQEVVHVHERHPRGLAQPRDLQPPLRLLQHLRGAAGAADRPNGLHQRSRAGDLPGDLRHRRARRVAAAHDVAARPDPGNADL